LREYIAAIVLVVIYTVAVLVFIAKTRHIKQQPSVYMIIGGTWLALILHMIGVIKIYDSSATTHCTIPNTT